MASAIFRELALALTDEARVPIVFRLRELVAYNSRELSTEAFTRFLDDLHRRIFRLISSSDTARRLGGMEQRLCLGAGPVETATSTLELPKAGEERSLKILHAHPAVHVCRIVGPSHVAYIEPFLDAALDLRVPKPLSERLKVARRVEDSKVGGSRP